ncbi:family 43 glycosylhydrolase [Galbibacter sp. EGI 63066]|uniref:family 43 glycosylhydrolase n=1 Tax=Galbibacter sp. EGI 63066 TaxID=2993559 RepID=UPI002248D789|nr:family 43 glycosylhydrolase [Galbibacter sp. EGI 63066]MCX2678664.1 family 43 glycosylhydrolase [Galbibacter sp. EGI 63066]
MMYRAIFLVLIFLPLCLLSQTETTLIHSAGKVRDSSYTNPILAGDYPDPSIFRDGDDYYMTHSSFEYYPGLLIWHSKDLVNWEPVCHALHKNVGSVWAPEFLKYQDKYYIYFPAGGTNWVITADSPKGPWSDPVDLKVGQIDPGHVVDLDGKRYLHMNYGKVVELSDDGLSAKGKEVSHSYDGWDIPDDWDVACKCLESPKLTYKDGYFYLTVAEGGTVGPATAHMVVSARSKSPLGPWENSPHNPIVHTWSKDEKWHAKGHGTLVEDREKNWWIVYHAYERDFYTLGRQTLMEPVEWTEEGWFKVPEDIQTNLPIRKKVVENGGQMFSLSDTFEGDKLGLQWTFYKEYDLSRVQVGDGMLQFRAEGDNPGNSAPLLCVPSDESYEIQVNYELVGDTQGGLVLFYDQSMYAGLVVNEGKFTIYRRGQPLNAGTNLMGQTGYLKIRNVGNTVTFYYSPDGEEWQKIERSFVVDSYNHTAFGGFLSLKIGLVSIGEGSVNFRDFVYSRID